MLPLLLACFLLAGCSSRAGYPDVQTSDYSAVKLACHQCGQAIESPQKQTILEIGAAQYVVCSEDCQQKQAAWHESQFGRSP
jgi:hypothetical protein